jgi:hypothetical protein
MTTIIHPVGNGDLGINITHIPRPERLTAQKNAETEILQKIRCRNTLDLVSVLTKDQTRTAPTPLALTLASLECPLQDVHILLYGTNQGVSGTETNTIAHLLEKAMNLPEVKKNIEEKYGLRFDVQVIGDGGLQEETRTSSLDETLRNIPSTEDVIVNGISAATMTVLSIMGTVDRLGFNWRLSASPGMTENKAIFVNKEKIEEAPFYWLRSLGYLIEAKDWKTEHNKIDLTITAQHKSLINIANKFRDTPQILTEDELAQIVRLDMARADIGAGLALRAWVEKHYETLLYQEQDTLKYNLHHNLFAKGDKKKAPTLGEAINAAKQLKDNLREKCPKSADWLSLQGNLNEIGKKTVHGGETLDFSDFIAVNAIAELPGEFPDWLSRPNDCSILYIFGCGFSSRGDYIPERVLKIPPKKDILAAIPGRLKNSPEPRATFVALHSKAEKSKQLAINSNEAAKSTNRALGWSESTPSTFEFKYEGSSSDEYSCTPEVLDSAENIVKKALNVTSPAAVVIVGTGQKPAIYGALKAAQQWCAEHASPLFITTYFDIDDGQTQTQFHRIALHSDAKGALRDAASASLRNFNLISAARVLRAGDQELIKRAEECDRLKEEYQTAVKEPLSENCADYHAGTLISILRAISFIIDQIGEGNIDPRLVVIAAEAVKFNPRPAGTTLFHEGSNFKLISRLKPGETPPRSRKLKDLPRGDYLRILAEIRNRLVVTHGNNPTSVATQDTLNDFAITTPQLHSYQDVLQCTIDSLEDAAVALGVSTESDWYTRFMSLIIWTE